MKNWAFFKSQQYGRIPNFQTFHTGGGRSQIYLKNVNFSYQIVSALAENFHCLIRMIPHSNIDTKFLFIKVCLFFFLQSQKLYPLVKHFYIFIQMLLCHQNACSELHPITLPVQWNLIKFQLFYTPVLLYNEV